MRGFDFLQVGLTSGLRDERKLESLSKGLYPDIATSFETDLLNVEKCIRKTLKRWWDENQIGGLFDQFPSNKKCIHTLVSHIKSSDRPTDSFIPIEDRPCSVLYEIFRV